MTKKERKKAGWQTGRLAGLRPCTLLRCFGMRQCQRGASLQMIDMGQVPKVHLHPLDGPGGANRQACDWISKTRDLLRVEPGRPHRKRLWVTSDVCVQRTDHISARNHWTDTAEILAGGAHWAQHSTVYAGCFVLPVKKWCCCLTDYVIWAFVGISVFVHSVRYHQKARTSEQRSRSLANK